PRGPATVCACSAHLWPFPQVAGQIEVKHGSTSRRTRGRGASHRVLAWSVRQEKHGVESKVSVGYCAPSDPPETSPTAARQLATRRGGDHTHAPSHAPLRLFSGHRRDGPPRDRPGTRREPRGR